MSPKRTQTLLVLNSCLQAWIYIARGLSHFWFRKEETSAAKDLRHIFAAFSCLIKGENKKEVFSRFLLELPFKRGVTGTVPYGKSGSACFPDSFRLDTEGHILQKFNFTCLKYSLDSNYFGPPFDFSSINQLWRSSTLWQRISFPQIPPQWSIRKPIKIDKQITNSFQ